VRPLFQQLYRTPLTSSSLLGTPTELDWPGVTSFPDFKSSFPKWGRDLNANLIPGLDNFGQDLLENMLVYDPAGRISAKQACMHPYFEQGSAAHSGRGLGQTYSATGSYQ
jgi:cyclin-dependent kinase